MGCGEAEMIMEHKQRKRGTNGGKREWESPWGKELFQGRHMGRYGRWHQITKGLGGS